MALLLATLDFVDRHKDRSTLVGTDTKCPWDHPRGESAPMELTQIDCRRCTEGPHPVQATPDEFAPLALRHADPDAEVERKVRRLMQANNFRSVAMNVLSGDDSDTDSDTDLSAPPSLKVLADHYTDLQKPPDFLEHLRSNFTKEEMALLEAATCGQDKEEGSQWRNQRVGRITASVAHSVLHMIASTASNPDNYIVRQIMGDTSFTSPATEHGTTCEPIARELYVQEKTKCHNGLKVSESGLIVREDYPYLGASPDGIVECKCCGKGLLEIKCPYTLRNETVRDICKDKSYHLYLKDDQVCCKTTSSWYTQVHMQMFVSKLAWCDLVVYTLVPPFIAIIRIPYNEVWETENISTLHDFFVKFVVPKLCQ